jgi:hypothetical protein
MRGVARRLDGKAFQIEIFRQAALRGDPAKNRSAHVVETSVKIHRSQIQGTGGQLNHPERTR